MKLTLRIRPEPNNLATVWLIERSGAEKGIVVNSGLLYGTMAMAKAKDLAETLGLDVQDAVAAGAYAENPPEEKMARQAELFGEQDG